MSAPLLRLNQPSAENGATDPLKYFAENSHDNSLAAQYTSPVVFWVVLCTVAVIIIIGFALYFGWRSRKKRQSDIIAPKQVPPELLGEEPRIADEGMYVATVRGRDWLERIAVHHLGIRTDAQLEVHSAGVVLLLNGAPNIFIPVGDIVDVRLESGMNGKFVERDGLVVISWMLGDQEVSTGFRNRTATAKQPMYEALTALDIPKQDDQKTNDDKNQSKTSSESENGA